MCHSVINDVGEQDQSEVEEEGKGSLKRGGPEEEERAHFLSVRRDRGTGIRDPPTVASSFPQMILIEASLSGLKGDEKPREAEVTGSHQLGVSTCGTASTMSKVDAELLGLQWETSNVAGGTGDRPSFLRLFHQPATIGTNLPVTPSPPVPSSPPSSGRSDYQTITAATQISTQRWSHRRPPVSRGGSL